MPVDEQPGQVLTQTQDTPDLNTTPIDPAGAPGATAVAAPLVVVPPDHEDVLSQPAQLAGPSAGSLLRHHDAPGALAAHQEIVEKTDPAARLAEYQQAAAAAKQMVDGAGGNMPAPTPASVAAPAPPSPAMSIGTVATPQGSATPSPIPQA